MKSMATFQLSLPDRLKAAAEAQAAAAGCSSVDDYIACLIEADELPPISNELEAQLLNGLDSGPAVPITPEFIADLKRRSRGTQRGPA
jgi:antitoxin ParD1/3/4